MNQNMIAPGLIALLTILAAGNIAAESKADDWKETTRPADESFSTIGRNPYWVLEPGYQLVLEGKEGKKSVHLTITVLDETRKFGDVETRVVEERETEDGQLVEVSRNYFALGNHTHTLYYFGEDVDIYKNGKLNHEGSWHSGADGAKYGVMVPGEVKSGEKYYQESAVGVAMDRAENLTSTAKLKTPAGKFTNCLKTRETSPLEPDHEEFKIYAPGIGIAQDDNLKLISYGFVPKK